MTETPIKDMVVIEPTIFGDERGYFMEVYHEKKFRDMGLEATFVQDNESKSKKGVLRGLHFQAKMPQGKLVRVLSGSVYDVGVDLRKGSPTYGKWHGVVLTSENQKMLYIPEGFAHGFLVLQDAVFTYKCTNFYAPEYDSGIIWNDPTIGIQWPVDSVEEMILSEKDKELNILSEKGSPFYYKNNK